MGTREYSFNKYKAATCYVSGNITDAEDSVLSNTSCSSSKNLWSSWEGSTYIGLYTQSSMSYRSTNIVPKSVWGVRVDVQSV